MEQPVQPAKRPGGRKPLPPEARKVQLSIYLEPVTHQWLIARTRPDEGISQTLERLLSDLMSRDDPTEYR